jgi:hypothetical protein
MMEHLQTEPRLSTITTFISGGAKGAVEAKRVGRQIDGRSRKLADLKAVFRDLFPEFLPQIIAIE